MRRFVTAIFPALLLAVLNGCGGSSSSPAPPPPKQSLRLAVDPATIDLVQYGTKALATVTITATCENVDTVHVDVSGIPSGLTASVMQPTCSTPGSVDFVLTDVTNARATSYTAAIGSASVAGTPNANVAINIIAQAAVTQTVTGAQTAFMSTSFQLADWSYSWLHDHPVTIPPLGQLQEQHIRIQLIDGAIPQLDAANWDFTKADEMIQPLLAVGDDSPELQIGTVPAFIGDSSGHYVEANLPQFAEYCANLVRYYNKGGFDIGGKHFQSPSSTPIKVWGIFNEPNINGMTDTQYVTMYNTVAPAMLAVDPSIRLVGMELADWTGQAQGYLPALVGGITQPVDAMATHYYSGCNQADSDKLMLSQIQMFHDQIAYIRSTMDTNPAMVSTPIWITENNVNADYDKGNGISMCNGGPFTEDPRGSSPYFAAWRPYGYSQMVQAGARGIWHWSYAGGRQYGEYADDSTPYLSYWVDFTLSHQFGQSPMDVLTTTTSEADRIEVFAAQDGFGKRVVMVVNHDVANDSDNNGAGVPKTVLLDLNNAGAFNTARLTTIDKNTSVSNGPGTTVVVPSSGVLTLNFPGYGVQFVELTN